MDVRGSTSLEELPLLQKVQQSCNQIEKQQGMSFHVKFCTANFKDAGQLETDLDVEERLLTTV